jgi:hypothetical protein
LLCVARCLLRVVVCVWLCIVPIACLRFLVVLLVCDDLLNSFLLQNGWELVMVEEIQHRMLKTKNKIKISDSKNKIKISYQTAKINSRYIIRQQK